jgi:lysophospholipase L1-like esterase
LIGSSISLGWSATGFNGYAQQLAVYLPSQITTTRWTMDNLAVAGEGSIAAVTSQLPSANPTAQKLIMLELAVNDADALADKQAAETIIRSIRAANPAANMVCLLFGRIADRTGTDTTNLIQSVFNNWIALANHYGIAYIDVHAVLAADVLAANHTLAQLFTDTVHLSDIGHALSLAAVQSTVLSLSTGGTQSGNLPDPLY